MRVFETLRADVRAVFDRDPAAKSLLEVLLCYPGLHALRAHRVAHVLYRWRLFTLARLISHLSRFLTGIEIHPGAAIGRGIFIDHGMGVVIGETTRIADRVTIYQGVTLGGTGKGRGQRHPIVERDVVIGAGAKVLGEITMGNNSRIGAGAVVITSVPPGCTVVGIPGRVVVRNGHKVDSLAHGDLPDPVLDALSSLDHQLKVLGNRIKVLEERSRKPEQG